MCCVYFPDTDVVSWDTFISQGWQSVSPKAAMDEKQGCQMAYFQTQSPILGKFWRVLQWKILVYFMTIWSILPPFGIYCGYLVYFIVIRYILLLCVIFYCYLVYFIVIWYILLLFGIFFPVLVCFTEKNLATLNGRRRRS
jgi:hypothetical protein